MQWSKAKTILITMLILANCFLFFSLRSLYLSKQMITDEFAQNAVTALKKNDLNIDASILPREKLELSIFFYDLKDNYASFAQKLLSDVTVSKQDNNSIYTGSNGSLIVYEDNSFEYIPKAQPKQVEQATDEKAESLAKTFVGLSGNDNKNFDIISKKGDKNGYTVVIQQLINGVKINDCTVTIDVEGDNVISAKGTMIINAPTSIIDTNRTDAVNALFSISSAYDGKMDIESMQVCYVTTKSQGQGSIALTPMYELTANGQLFFFDLSTNQLISK